MTVINKKVVAVLYEYFYPGYKAGGPIQSLMNMILTLQDRFEFKIITTAYDLNETIPYNDVMIDKWNDVQLSPDALPMKVWYASSLKISIGQMRNILHQASADIVFINGLYTQWVNYALLLKKFGLLGKSKLIISPRGMLQQGALNVKPTKKKIFLNVFKVAGLFKNVTWHATTTDEKLDIQQIISTSARIIIAANVPKKPVSTISFPQKNVKELRLVYLSLITEKKNLLQLIQVLHTCKYNISLDIYGPVKEENYWQLCKQKMANLPSNININYKGDVKPFMVQATLQQYHALALLTHGENFGHALYESLSAARPVITSNFTPWNNLEANHAGWNCSLDGDERIALVLQQIAEMDNTSYAAFCTGAWQLANNYYNNSDFINSYSKLFA
ncbi:MAG: glycosyltransferase [Chitinophagaceae bacterium]|nr:glycosyltransferase [Chitinophagaceae bacterium]